MTSLYYVTEHVKLLLKWAGIIIGSIIMLIFLFRFLVFVKNTLFPTPPPPPTMTWGKLPPILFPESKYIQKFSYTVNTLSGELPQLPDRALVYLIATPEASLQSLKNAIDIVENVRFDQEPVRISETIYQWYNPEPPGQKIQYDIVSRNFKLTSDFLNNPDTITGNNLPDDKQAQQIAEGFLASLDDFPSDLVATGGAHTYFSIQDGNLVPTTSLSNAQIIQVDFYQNAINDIPIYYSEYPKSLITILIGGGESNGTIVDATYIHHNLTDISATYPIYTAQQALEKLKKGEGFVASYKGSSSNILIQNAKLGYYLAKDSTTYLMPIIVFEGNNDFVAFVSAVKEQ